MQPGLPDFSAGPSFQSPPGSFPMPPPMVAQPPMPFPNMNPMSMMPPQASFNDPRFASYPHPRRHPVRIHRRYRSRRCRPVIHIYDSDSCESISTCSSKSSCCHVRQDRAPQQQPIILLPIQCQQQPSAITGPIQTQTQPMVLPSIQIQPQQHQPHLSLTPMSNVNPTPLIISNIEPMFQPSSSMQQIIPFGKAQQIQAGPIQYVQATPQSSSSQLQLISGERHPSLASQHVFVNSKNKKRSTIVKPIPRPVAKHNLLETDLKFGRRPFDWCPNDGNKRIIKDNIHIKQRGTARLHK